VRRLQVDGSCKKDSGFGFVFDVTKGLAVVFRFNIHMFDEVVVTVASQHDVSAGGSYYSPATYGLEETRNRHLSRSSLDICKYHLMRDSSSLSITFTSDTDICAEQEQNFVPEMRLAQVALLYELSFTYLCARISVVMKMRWSVHPFCLLSVER
jgi:hypothetical protein